MNRMNEQTIPSEESAEMQITQLKQKKILGMIGLAKRAGKLVCGTDAVLTAASSKKKPFLILASADASSRTKKQLTDKSAFYRISFLEIPIGKEALASSVGKRNSLVSAAAVMERAFADQIISLVNS